jgi:hypothetical protein
MQKNTFYKGNLRIVNFKKGNKTDELIDVLCLVGYYGWYIDGL